MNRLEQIQAVLEENNQPKFRLEQIKTAIFSDSISRYSQISNLSKPLKEQIISVLGDEILTLTKVHEAKGEQATKFFLLPAIIIRLSPSDSSTKPTPLFVFPPNPVAPWAASSALPAPSVSKRTSLPMKFSIKSSTSPKTIQANRLSAVPIPKSACPLIRSSLWVWANPWPTGQYLCRYRPHDGQRSSWHLPVTYPSLLLVSFRASKNSPATIPISTSPSRSITPSTTKDSN